MDNYLDTPFLLEDPQPQSSQPHETWKTQFGQPHHPHAAANAFQQPQAQHRLSPHAAHAHQGLTQLEADVAFFASSASSGDRGSVDVASNGDNALGLMGSFEAPPSPTSQPIVMHSHSMPSSFDFAHHQHQHSHSHHHHHLAGMQPHHQLRRESSVSDAASLSHSSSSRSSHYEGNSPRSLTPAQSPMGLPSSLSGMSGLALGTPITSARSLSGESVSPFSTHAALLSLSRGQEQQQQHMGPPPPALKRRATGLGHSIYTNVKAEEDEEEEDELEQHQHHDVADFDDATPMPPSTEQFKGHRAAHLTPITPINPGRTSIGSLNSSCGETPGHSYSNSTTPDESYRSAGGSSVGPFESPYGGRMHRLHSFDDDDDDVSPMQHGSQTYDRSLESMWADKERSSLMMSHALSPFGRANLAGSPAHASSAMSRTSSAPMLSLGSYSLPETPIRGGGSLMHAPSTPANEHLLLSPAYDTAFTAPMMMPSRSLSSLHSPPASVSPMSLVENMPRRESAAASGSSSSSSRAGGVTRTATPRSRARNTGPPPLIVSSADKMHVCHCGKRFKRMEHLKRHNRTHTQERPHRCPVETCGKWFGRTDNLAQHLKTHYRAVGGRSAELMALTKGEDVTAASLHASEPRHNPHAAASAAAAVASKVVAAAASKRRSNTLSNDALGGPIALNRRAAPVSRQALSPTGSVSANSSPLHSTAGPLDLNWH